jgi:acyl carrier protein
MEMKARIVKVMSDTFGVAPSTISDTSSPETIPSWDSMNHIHLVVALEAEFGVSFDPEKALEMTSVTAIEQTVRELGGR